MHRRNSIAAEQRYNFGRKRKASNASNQPKHPRVQSWTHKFVCLPKTEQARLPTTIKERNEIVLAGLGEKKITIPDITCGSQKFTEIIYDAYPKLQKGGGFELLKCNQSSRELDLIPFSISYSPQLLKEKMGTAKVYIRPIQMDLDLAPQKDDETIASEVS